MNDAERRLEDKPLLSTGGIYVADVRDELLAGSVWAHFVRSHNAHAEVVGIDAAAAKASPGVLAVFTAADLDIGPMPPVLPRFDVALSPPVLASGRVRYVGEPIAVVVAVSAASAADAAELVEVELRELAPVVDVVDAMGGSTALGAAGVSNVVAELAAGDGDPATMFDGCDVVVRTEMRVPRVAACPIEARAAASAWRDGRLHHWVSTQGPHSVKRVLTAVFGCDESVVRVIAPDVGGGFGPKFSNYAEDVAVAWAARALGRPVRWCESRTESMTGLHHGRGQRQTVTIGGGRDGAITAYRLDVVQDAGAYASLGAYAPEATIRMTTGVYRIPRVRATATAVRTSTTPVSAYRGTGRPEATCAIERAVDRFARAAGLDPVEVRLRNMVTSAEMPYETPVGTVYDSGDYPATLRLARDLAGIDVLRREQQRRRVANGSRHLGIGISAYVESTAAGPGMEFATLTVDASGSVVVDTGSSPHGQGHVTTWTMLVQDRLGFPAERITVRHGDTDAVAAGLGTFASRSTQLAGSAIVVAGERLVEQARLLAADVLEANVADITFDPSIGRCHAVGSPDRSIGWAALAAAAPGAVLREQAMFTGEMTFPFGCHVAVVDVDAETGEVVLVRHVAVDDAGTLVNRTIAEGQVHGGIAQAVGEAMFEEVVFDERGTPLTMNLADYGMPSAADMPSFEVCFTETPAVANPLGAKGIGESGTIGAVAAIQNAVCDALSWIGVEHVDLPLVPERVWRAIRSAAAHATGRH